MQGALAKQTSSLSTQLLRVRSPWLLLDLASCPETWSDFDISRSRCTSPAAVKPSPPHSVLFIVTVTMASFCQVITIPNTCVGSSRTEQVRWPQDPDQCLIPSKSTVNVCSTFILPQYSRNISNFSLMQESLALLKADTQNTLCLPVSLFPPSIGF